MANEDAAYWRTAREQTARANDQLDALRRAKRQASEQTTNDVHEKVLARAKNENWNQTPGPRAPGSAS